MCLEPDTGYMRCLFSGTHYDLSDEHYLYNIMIHDVGALRAGDTQLSICKYTRLSVAVFSILHFIIVGGHGLLARS